MANRDLFHVCGSAWEFRPTRSSIPDDMQVPVLNKLKPTSSPTLPLHLGCCTTWLQICFDFLYGVYSADFSYSPGVN